MTLDLAALTRTSTDHDAVRITGRLRSVIGLSLRADLPDARVGELVYVERDARTPLVAEVVGFDRNGVTLLPLGSAEGLSPDDAITPARSALGVRFGDDLLGRVLDGLGQPIDGGGALVGDELAVQRPAPPAFERARIERVLPLGVRALDAFLSIGEGQRIGLFAGSGVGKSTLLGQLARNSDADVVVVCLVGERGRELNDFLHEQLSGEAHRRSVVVCATSDAPALVRMKCPHVATTIAEGFRDQGKRVLLLVDSITRFARAAREVGLAAGEAPVRRGYPPSVMSALPNLVERAGVLDSPALRGGVSDSPALRGGSITAVYSVLVEGDDLDEPVADELRGLLDGHVVLSRELAARGRFPAIDVTRSLSRLFGRLVDDAHRDAALRVREHLARYEEKRDLVALGAYRAGSDAKLDAALARIERIEAFLCQPSHERSSWDDTLAALRALV
jgi:ATP synthase in type III secretion protein N